MNPPIRPWPGRRIVTFSVVGDRVGTRSGRSWAGILGAELNLEKGVAAHFTQAQRIARPSPRGCYPLLRIDSKWNLGIAVWRVTLATNGNRRESSRHRQISASNEAFFLSAFQFSASQLYSNPPFPCLPSGRPLIQRPSPRKQFPRSPTGSTAKSICLQVRHA